MSFHPLSCFCLFLNEKFAVFLIFVPVYIMSVSLGYIKDFLFIKCFEQSDCSIQSQLGSTLWPHEMQHTKIPYSSLSPKVCSNSGPLSQWCHPTISSSVSPFSPCPQSFPASGSFSLSQLFTSSGQSIRASASSSVLWMNIRVGFLWDWLAWSPCCSRESQESSTAPQFESISYLALSLLYGPTLISIHYY